MMKKGLLGAGLLFALCAVIPIRAAIAIDPVQRGTASGMRIILERNDSAAAQITLLLKSGSGLEPAGKKGIAQIMNNIVYWLLNAPKSSPDLVDIETEPDYTRISLTTLAGEIRPALTRIKRLLTEPLYSYDAVVDLKKFFGTRVRTMSGMPQAYFDFTAAFYGAAHPYNNWPGPESLAGIGGADVYKWYRQTYQPGNAILSLVGNIPENLAELEKFFGDMPNESVDRRLLVQPVTLTQNQQVEREDPNAKAASLCIGFAAPRLQDPDYPAFKIIVSYLDEYFHYFEELRVKEGLFYAPEIYYNGLEKPKAPNLAFIVMTDPDSIPAVATKTLAMVRDLAENGIAQPEITKVVKAIKAESAEQQASGSGMATLNALSQYLRTSLVYEENLFAKLDEVKPEDIRKAAAKYFKNYIEVSRVPSKIAADL